MNLDDIVKSKLKSGSTAEFIAGTLASLGATAAVIALMKNPLAGAKGITKLLMKLGIFALACKVGEDTEEYLCRKIKEIVDIVNEGKKVAKEVAENA